MLIMDISSNNGTRVHNNSGVKDNSSGVKVSSNSGVRGSSNNGVKDSSSGVVVMVTGSNSNLNRDISNSKYYLLAIVCLLSIYCKC